MHDLEKIAPSDDMIEIIPDDGSAAYNGVTLTCMTTGIVEVETMGGTRITFPLEAGFVFPLRVRRVYAAGTTAVGIRGLR